MTLEEAEELVKAIRFNNHYELNDWEEDFIENIEENIRLGLPLSIKQRMKVEQIYAKCYE